jgi:hypothetical protein
MLISRHIKVVYFSEISNSNINDSLHSNHVLANKDINPMGQEISYSYMSSNSTYNLDFYKNIISSNVLLEIRLKKLTYEGDKYIYTKRRGNQYLRPFYLNSINQNIEKHPTFQRILKLLKT